MIENIQTPHGSSSVNTSNACFERVFIVIEKSYLHK